MNILASRTPTTCGPTIRACATCPWLSHVNVSRCRAVGNPGIAALSKAPRLVALDTSRNKGLTDEGLAKFLDPAKAILKQQAEVEEPDSLALFV